MHTAIENVNPLDEEKSCRSINRSRILSIPTKQALDKVKRSWRKCNCEGGVFEGEEYESGCMFKPAIAEADNSWEIVQHETICSNSFTSH